MIQDIIVSLVTVFITFIATTIFHNRLRLKIWFQSLFRPNKEIRLSCAYLFRIKYDNKYLLINGKRIQQYQPVGGVYKYYASFGELKTKLKIEDESENRFYEDGDLRQVTKRKSLMKYLDWFDTRKNREVTVIRELIEELYSDEISIDEFIKSIEIEYLKTVKEKIKFSQHFQMDEQKIFDIYEARIPNFILDDIIKDNRYCLVEVDEINKMCCERDGLSKPISETSKYIV